MCSLEEDLHGINLSLQVDDFDDDGELKLDIIRGEDIEIERKEEEEPEKVSSRSEVSFIPEGRFRPLFLLCGESIFRGFLIFVKLECLRKMGLSLFFGRKITNGRLDSRKRLLFGCKRGFFKGDF